MCIYTKYTLTAGIINQIMDILCEILEIPGCMNNVFFNIGRVSKDID